MRNTLILSAVGPGNFDGVGDYSEQLARHLSVWSETTLITTDTSGSQSLVGQTQQILRLKTGWSELWRLRKSNPLYDADLAILQYVPQLYLQSKDSLWLLLWLLYLRFIRNRKVAVTVHENAIPWHFSLKKILARLGMMIVMIVLGSISHVVIVSFSKRCDELRRLLFWKRKNICIIPVGSNIPNASGAGSAYDRREKLSLTIFGQPAGMNDRLVCAMKEWISNKPVQIHWIGRSETEIWAAWGTSGKTKLFVYEKISIEEVSALLRETDLFVAPLVDGVSTRRTTIMAALAHGLPIVGTDGPCTDPLLRNSPAFLLSSPEDLDAWIRNLDCWIQEEAKRASMKQAAEKLYKEYFTWETIAQEYRKNLSVDVMGPRTNAGPCHTSWKTE